MRNPTRSAFAQDSWKLGRVTLNLGARWDWQANSLAGETAPQSRYFPEAVYAAGDRQPDHLEHRCASARRHLRPRAVMPRRC